MNFQRLFAGLVGLGFVVVGVLRFIPMATVPDLSRAQPVHGLIHLTTGAAFVWSALAAGGRHAQVLNRWVGLFYVALGFLGLPGVVLFSDNATHLFVGLAASALGWLSPGSSVWLSRSARFRRVFAGAASALLALIFVLAGGRKLLGVPSMVDEFARIGVGQWLRIAIGALEVSAATALLSQRWRRWSASGLAVLMVGATATNLAVLQRSGLLPATLLVLSLVVLGTTVTAARSNPG